MIVRVTNTNKGWLLRDRYGGVQYEFPPDKQVLIPAEAAEHIFGYNLGKKERWQKFLRMGIANRPDGRALWEGIKIKAGSVEPTGAVREAA